MPPNKFFVHPSYPNPFNPITVINYEIPELGNMNIKIHNINGQQILDYKTIVAPGYHSYDWDASKFSSGIYFISVIYNNQKLSKIELSINSILDKLVRKKVKGRFGGEIRHMVPECISKDLKQLYQTNLV